MSTIFVCRCDCRLFARESILVDECDESCRAPEGLADGLGHRTSESLRRTSCQTSEDEGNVQTDGKLWIGLELVRHTDLREQST